MDPGYAAWTAAIGILDPTTSQQHDISPGDKHALESPATLAAHLWKGYRRRAHTDLIAESIKGLEEGDYDRLLVVTPPQVGKTLTAVVWAGFWWLCLHPDNRIIIISYGDQLAVKRGRAIRALIEEHGARFGLHLDRSNHSAHDWSLLSGGGCLSVGIGSGITGNNGDIVFIDDPHKNRQESESPVMRGHVHDAYGPDMMSRLAPGAPIILVQTRWHEDDLAGRRVREEGRIESGGQWKVVHLPALCVDPASDALGRAFGAPLPHPKIEEHDVARALLHWERMRSGQPPRDWASLYQGDPKPSVGALLTWDMLRQRRCYEFGMGLPCAQPKIIAVSIDPSGGGRDTAGIIGGYLGDDDRLYLTHDRSGVMPSALWARMACELAAEIDADRFIVEVNFGSDMATLAVRTAWEALRRENPTRYSVFCPRVTEVRGKKNKVLRAEPIAQQWIEGKVRTAQYLADVESEWATWQAGSQESPGRIDASVYMALELLPVPESGEATVVDILALGGTDLTAQLKPGQVGLG